MSKYPSQIDDSVSLPVVRNNITELTSEVINSLRSAIINIERTLGINPHGDLRTLDERVSVSIGADGIISSAAITNLNLLSGQISDSDVAINAGISESKINLIYSTEYLQTQISIISGIIDSVYQAVESIKTSSTLHFNKSTLHLHNAAQIDVASSPIGYSSSALVSLPQTDLQTLLESFISSHINLLSSNITEDNRSHLASQIFYSNPSVLDETVGSVESALNYIMRLNSYNFSNLFSDFAENSLFSKGNTSDEFDSNTGRVLFSGDITFSDSTLNQFDISFLETELPDLEIGDLIEITHGLSSKKYTLPVVSFNYSVLSQSKVKKVTVSGSILESYVVGTTGILKKVSRQIYNKSALNLSVVPVGSTSSKTIITSNNPNSASIISSGFKIPNSPSNITIEFEGGSHTVDVYDANAVNSIQSVVFKLNLYFSDNNLPIIASRIGDMSCFELCLSHMLPNSSELTTRPFLRVIVSSSDDGLEILGFKDQMELYFYGSNENNIIINGSVLGRVFDLNDITSFSEFALGDSSLSIRSGYEAESGIKENDFVYIEHNGSFLSTLIVKSVLPGNVTFSNPITFSNASDETTKLFLIKNTHTIDINNPSSSISASSNNKSYFVVDVFLTEQGSLVSRSKAEFFGTVESIDDNTTFVSQCKILDVSRGVTPNVKSKLVFDVNKNLYIETSLTQGVYVYAQASGEYKIPFPDGNGYALVSLITSSAMTTSGFTVDFETLDQGFDSALLIGTVGFSNYLSYHYSGLLYGDVNVSSVEDKRNFGYVSSDQINSTFYKDHLDLPRSELNANFVSAGFDKLSESQTNLKIGRGIAYINGRRVVYQGGTIEYTLGVGERIVVFLDTNGCISTHKSTSEFSGDFQKIKIPLYFSNYEKYSTTGAVWSTPNMNQTGIFTILFKSFGEVQSKFTEIIVGDSGNFKTIRDAVEYLNSIDELFGFGKDSYVIKLQNQIHMVNETIVLGRFDISIEGVGDRCGISISGKMAKPYDNINLAQNIGLNPETSMFYAIANGIKGNKNINIRFKDIKFIYNNIIEGLLCVIIINSSVNSANIIHAKYTNCKFYGSSDGDNLKPVTAGSKKLYLVPVVFTSSITSAGNRSSLMMTGCHFYKVGSRSSNLSGPIVYISHSDPFIQDNITVNNIIIKDCHIVNSADNPEDFRYITRGQDVSSFQDMSVLTKNYIVSDCVIYDE